jgi:hypothetical protein
MRIFVVSMSLMGRITPMAPIGQSTAPGGYQVTSFRL